MKFVLELQGSPGWYFDGSDNWTEDTERAVVFEVRLPTTLHAHLAVSPDLPRDAWNQWRMIPAATVVVRRDGKPGDLVRLVAEAVADRLLGGNP